MAHARTLKSSRAVFMHDALSRGFDYLSDNFCRAVHVAFFRQLRFKMLERRSWRMYNKAKLRNWLRICNRFKHLLRGMDRFHALRTKYRCFLQWLRHVEKAIVLCSRGLRPMLRRRQKLMSRYR